MIIGRIRVLIAGDIYVNRSLVRPFLEDDGYEVVAEALTRDDVLPAVHGRQPDALVIDDRLLSARGNGRLLHKVRRAAPEAKVVIVASG
ncbi:MAG TPA: response regulator, partial [Actinomycetota bacterium]|nr:response regulator [Actinomycetota bacterium]